MTASSGANAALLAELQAFITPSLLERVTASLMNFKGKGAGDELTYSEAESQMLSDAGFCFDALVKLSEVSGGQAALLALDWAAGFLPAPEDKSFPIQALGLLMLLDQAPRTLLMRRGIEIRWIDGYFGPLGHKLVRQLLALPAAVRPFEPARWMDEHGYSRTQYFFAWTWLITPLVHSEQHVDLLAALQLVNAQRTRVEEWSGLSDPWRPQLASILQDPTSFRRLASSTPEPDTELVLEGKKFGRKPAVWDFFFWLFMIMDAHYPVVAVYGRDPGRNGPMGRAAAPSEKAHLDAVAKYGRMPEALFAQIKADADKGVWTPIKPLEAKA